MHDTNHLKNLLDKTSASREVSADNGYVDGVREVRLKQGGWRVTVQRKAEAGKPLVERQ